MNDNTNQPSKNSERFDNFKLPSTNHSRRHDKKISRRTKRKINRISLIFLILMIVLITIFLITKIV
jgi:hypothetical protein